MQYRKGGADYLTYYRVSMFAGRFFDCRIYVFLVGRGTLRLGLARAESPGYFPADLPIVAKGVELVAGTFYISR